MIYTVFSTDDSPYMQWQSELLEYSWKKVGQPGELIRLVSTDRPDELPSHREARCVAVSPWRIHPQTGDDYAPYNKPSSLAEWIDREQPEGTVLLLDPDCVFRRPVEQEVLPGKPVGQYWVGTHFDGGAPCGLGPGFGALSLLLENQTQPPDPVMIPNLIHTADLQQIAWRWLELTAAVREHVSGADGERMWESDMFGYVLVCAEAGLQHEIGTLGVCTNWDLSEVPDSPLLHYCQPLFDQHGEQIWQKHEYRAWQPVCDPSRAAVDYGRELLELIDEYRIARVSEGRGALPRLCPDVVVRYAGAETTLQPPGRDEALSLDEAAEAVWELCDGLRDVSAIEGALPPGAPPRSEVARTLLRLEAAGIVELVV